MTLSAAFALAAALSSAVNLMTQHSASAGAPKRERAGAWSPTCSGSPPWLLGWIAAAGAFAFQAVALHYGQLSVVQPVLVTELVLVLALRRVWIRQVVVRAAWAAALVVCGALGAFLWAAEPTGGHSSPEAAQWLSALPVFCGTMALLAVLGTRGSQARRTALLAAAAGFTWALAATFVKTAAETLATSGISGMLKHWPVYALVGHRRHRLALEPVRSARRALERVPAASGHHQPARQHHLEYLAVRRALHRKPAEDRRCRRGHGGLGRRSHLAVANSTEDLKPSRVSREDGGA